MTLTVDIKRKLYDQCVEIVEDRIARARSEMEAAQAAANEETKSSVGDKYETTRAMMQREKVQAAQRLAEAGKLRQALGRFDPEKITTEIQLGSLVETDNGNFFFAVPAGKLTHEAMQFMAISPGAPIGKIMLGLQAGESAKFRDKVYAIKSVI